MDILAAEKLGMSVLELEAAPFYWRERALAALSAEAEADRSAAALARAQHRGRIR